MKQLFNHKIGKILVVENSGPNRFLLSETLDAVGFSSLIGVETVQAALNVLATESIHWIVTELSANKPENGLQLAKLVTENLSLKNTFVSLILEPNEQYVIPRAFELGALSWHPKPFLRESLLSEWNTLLELASTHDFSATLVAAHYLREELKNKGRQAELLAFEKELIKAYPTNSNLFLNMIHPLYHLGDKQGARSMLRLVSKISPALADKVTHLDKELFNGEIPDETTKNEILFNFLNLKKVIVVDPDETTHTGVRNFMKMVGCPEIQCFDNGLTAHEYITKNPEPDLIIQEWRLPKLSGSAFLQRVKSSSAVTTPVIIASSLIKKEDVPFIQEMGVATFIPKPLEEETFIRSLTWTMQQDRMPKNQTTLERKIRSHLAKGDIKAALVLQQKYQENPQIPDHAKKLIEAELTFANQQYDLARSLALETIKFLPNSVHALNLLGKILLKLGEYELSLKCFEKAQKMAPQNIERLCMIAELNAEIGDKCKATTAIENAMILDDSSETGLESRIKVAIKTEDHTAAKKYLSQFRDIEKIIAAMNNAAVAMIGNHKIEEGIVQYALTLNSIPNKRTDLLALVFYNLGLAHARLNQLQQSLNALDECILIKESKVLKKAEALKIKVLLSLEKGYCFDPKEGVYAHSDLYLEGKHDTSPTRPHPKEASSITALSRQIDASLVMQKGDIGCYLIYRVPQGEDESLKLIKQSLVFNKKEASQQLLEP